MCVTLGNYNTREDRLKTPFVNLLILEGDAGSIPTEVIENLAPKHQRFFKDVYHPQFDR